MPLILLPFSSLLFLFYPFFYLIFYLLLVLRSFHPIMDYIIPSFIESSICFYISSTPSVLSFLHPIMIYFIESSTRGHLSSIPLVLLPFSSPLLFILPLRLLNLLWLPHFLYRIISPGRFPLSLLFNLALPLLLQIVSIFPLSLGS